MHNASWDTKLWPEAHWVELIKRMERSGYSILLPWGNSVEEARAKRLASGCRFVTVLPKLTLSEIGYVLSKAKACISVDTGLSHIAGALGVPTLSLMEQLILGSLVQMAKANSISNRRYLVHPVIKNSVPY